MKVDVDDTTRCPVEPACGTCGGGDDLAVATAGTQVGIVCLTLCWDCAEDGALPSFSLGEAVRRCGAHAGHLGATVDDLAITDSRK